MALRLTVLGCHAPYPAPGGACPGYLVESQRAAILLECGSGVVANLLRVFPLERLDAVVLSHLHPDHAGDVPVLRYAWQLRAWPRRADRRPLPVYAPQEPGEEFRRLAAGDVLVARGVTAADALRFGDMELRFARARHPVYTCAVAVEAGGRRLVYSADTGEAAEVRELARGADLFLCEATALERDRARAEEAGHLTVSQAVAMARAAAVRALVLTHRFPEYPEADLRAEAEAACAREGFAGRVDLAAPLQVYEL